MLSSRVVVTLHRGHTTLAPGVWSGLRRWRVKAPCADRIAPHNLHWYLAFPAAPPLPLLLAVALDFFNFAFPEWLLSARFLFDGGASESTEFFFAAAAFLFPLLRDFPAALDVLGSATSSCANSVFLLGVRVRVRFSCFCGADRGASPDFAFIPMGDWVLRGCSSNIGRAIFDRDSRLPRKLTCGCTAGPSGEGEVSCRSLEPLAQINQLKAQKQMAQLPS